MVVVKNEAVGWREGSGRDKEEVPKYGGFIRGDSAFEKDGGEDGDDFSDSDTGDEEK